MLATVRGGVLLVEAHPPRKTQAMAASITIAAISRVLGFVTGNVDGKKSLEDVSSLDDPDENDDKGHHKQNVDQSP